MIQSLLPHRRRIAVALSAALASLMLASSPAAAEISVQSADRFSYVLFAPGSRSTSMSGSTEDLRRARALRAGNEALLYVRDARGAYVIRDAATLRRAQSIFAPQEALGARQSELGSRQAALGSRQAALGAQQAQLGAEQADARPSRAVELGRRQNELGRQQSVLGEQQHALGRQQHALGQQQHRLAREAQAKMRALLDEAVRRGLAQRVN
jgi:hypothetical protein